MKQSIIVICGPTACGKTSLSLSVADKFNGEIISADSMQIYKHLDIGTAKIKPADMRGIRHYMLDICEPDYNYSVAEYQIDATICIEEIISHGKIPIICGGTGFYIHSLMYDLNFCNTDPDNDYRLLLSEKSNEQLFNMLKVLDAKSAERIHINDTRRMIRRLEILKSNGVLDFNFRKRNEKYNFIPLCISMERSSLYNRINERVDMMINNGLKDEVLIMFDRYGEKCNSMKAIGYKELISYFKGECSFDNAVEKIKMNSRRYAKRQITWFKRESMQWFDVNEPNFNKSVIQYIDERLNFNND